MGEAGVAELPPRQRIAVVLLHLAGLSVPETAEVMGCAEGTVKATVHVALAVLRLEVEGDGLSGGAELGRRDRARLQYMTPPLRQ